MLGPVGASLDFCLASSCESQSISLSNSIFTSLVAHSTLKLDSKAANNKLKISNHSLTTYLPLFLTCCLAKHTQNYFPGECQPQLPAKLQGASLRKVEQATRTEGSEICGDFQWSAKIGNGLWLVAAIIYLWWSTSSGVPRLHRRTNGDYTPWILLYIDLTRSNFTVIMRKTGGHEDPASHSPSVEATAAGLKKPSINCTAK